jgi:predicted TIM-barrel fold metal-dependent hydrolase
VSLPDGQTLISADDHMDLNALPPGLWEERLPARFRDRAPRVEQTEEGPWWFVEGRKLTPSGRRPGGLLEKRQHGMRPGQPATRLEDMDEDRVQAQVIYGPTTTSLRFQDADLSAQCARVYNDWAAEFQRAAPDRLVLLPALPSHDPLEARDELLRCVDLGHRGAIVSDIIGRGDPIFEDSWLPFWDAAEEVGLPIHIHLSGGTHSLNMRPGSWRSPAFVAVVPMQLDETLSGMIFSGILEQRPGVRFVMGEAGLGWIPYVMERMDHELQKYGSKISDHRLSMLPSEIFARQVFTTYEDEKIGVELIPRIGADNVMWASDYPHGDTTWPDSRRAVADSPLAQHGADTLRKVTCENAARLYGIPF